MNKVQIAGINYTIEYRKHTARDSNVLGSCCGNSSEIIIDADLENERQKKTIIHEIIEAFNFEYELELEHRKITVLESAFFDLLKNNQELMYKIIDDKRKVM